MTYAKDEEAIYKMDYLKNIKASEQEAKRIPKLVRQTKSDAVLGLANAIKAIAVAKETLYGFKQGELFE